MPQQLAQKFDLTNLSPDEMRWLYIGASILASVLEDREGAFVKHTLLAQIIHAEPGGNDSLKTLFERLNKLHDTAVDSGCCFMCRSDHSGKDHED